MAVYQPLAHHLAQLGEEEASFSFDDMEQIIGRRLPSSASGPSAQQWWANTASHSQGKAWLDAGWRVDGLDLKARRIRFRRAGAGKPATAQAIPGLYPVTVRMIEDYAEEAGVSPTEAIAAILNERALQRRRELLAWFRGKSTYDGVSSVDLIREDRDAR